MSERQKLRLVRADERSSEPPDDAPPTALELREAAELAARLERGDDELANALRAAACPDELGAVDLDAILARALADDETVAPATRIEREGAARLRDALEGRGDDGPETAPLLSGLRAAWSPGDLSPETNEALVERALSGHHRPRSIFSARRHLPVTMAALTGLAAAAAAFVWLLPGVIDAPDRGRPTAAMERAPLVTSRSTAELFDPARPLSEQGAPSARVDRIADARSADLRANRFARWGLP